MGETDVHRAWMIRIYDLMAQRYLGQRVYVASDLLLYYEEGLPSKYIVPDDFIVLDCEPGDRRTFQTWKEGRIPNVVFEVTSKWTRRDDEVFKIKLYSDLGVRELFLYDPTADYLKPPLKGYRLVDEGAYAPLAPDADGHVESAELGIRLRLQGRKLVMTDALTGKRLLTEAETEREGRKRERQARQREREAREREHTAREAAEQRATAAEAEVARLRAEMERLRGSSD